MNTQEQDETVKREPESRTISNDTSSEGEALREELVKAVLELRKAWIAPHRYNLREAELNVARISDRIQQLDARISKHYDYLRQAESYQSRLYNRFDYVRLVDFPRRRISRAQTERNTR